MPRGVAASGTIGFAGAVLGALLNLLLVVVVGRALGVAGTGTFFQVVGWFLIVVAVLRLGADTGLLRTWALQVDDGTTSPQLSRSLWVAVIPVVAVSLVAAGAAHLLAPFLAETMAAPDAGEAQRMIRVVGWCLPAAALLAVLLNGLRGLGSVVAFTVLQNVAVPGLRVVLVLAVVVAGTGELPAVLVSWAVPLPLLLLVVGVLVVRRMAAAGQASPAPRPARGATWAGFWSFSGPRGVAAVLEVLLAWLDVLVVAALSSVADAGVYAVVTRLVRAGLVVDSAARLAVAPRIATLLARGDLASAGALFTAVSQAVILVAWPAYLLLMVFGVTVLRIFGDGFGRGGAVLVLLSAAMMIGLAAGMVQSLLLMGGRSKDQMLNKGAAVTVNLGLNLALVPELGITGAAIAWVVTLALDTALATFQVRRRMQVHLDLGALALPAGLTVGAFGGGCLLVRLVAGPGAEGLLLALVGCGAAYLACLWRLRVRLGLVGSLAA